MRVLHIPFTYYPDPVGGTEIYVNDLAMIQQRLGLEVAVAAPGSSDSESLHKSIPVRRYNVKSSSTDLRALYGKGNPVAATGLCSVIRDLQPDIIHVHAFSPGIPIDALKMGRQSGASMVYTYHTPTASCQRGSLMQWGNRPCDGRLDVRRCTSCTLHGLGSPRTVASLLGVFPGAVGSLLGGMGLSGGLWTAMRMTELMAIRHEAFQSLMDVADAVVVLADWTRDLLIRNNVPQEKLHFSRHGVMDRVMTTTRGNPRGGKAPVLKLAFLGRLHRAKGIDMVLSALSAMPQAAIALDIYGIVQRGDNPYVERLSRQITENSQVSLHPPVPRERVRRLLSDYDLVVVPSIGLETGPLVVLESFAAGVPVIGTRLGGIAELVTDGVDGLLVTPGSETAWVDVFRRVENERGLVDALRRGVRPPRMMDDVAQEMNRLYKSLRRPSGETRSFGASRGLESERLSGK